jgi:hypothetical protein
MSGPSGVGKHNDLRTEDVSGNQACKGAVGIQARFREMLVEAGMPMPDSIPAYTDIRVDPEGNLWLERFSVQGSQEHRWAVFSNSGEFLGHLGLPCGFRLSDLGTDWILGIHTDELGVERVKVFGLEKR